MTPIQAARAPRSAGSVTALARQAAVLGGQLACQLQNPRLWFSDLPADLELAKAHCRPCPLRAACLAGAVERGEPHGVWGGEIFARGRITAQKIPRGRPARFPDLARPGPANPTA
jgi:WhiB family transcriptional regulator, redox-sensing transcriptional regulator